ncbi:MAG: hydrogenase iron-sulfur subunit [Candidatus Helarchaeota archaeon]
MKNDPNRIPIFICTCGDTLREKIDFEKLKREVKRYNPNNPVNLFSTLCSKDGQNRILEKLNDGIEKFVIAACTPQKLEYDLRLFLKAHQKDEYSFDIANIREHCAWVHQDKTLATNKAVALINSSIKRIIKAPKIKKEKIKVEKRVLIIGAGIAGLQAAIDLNSIGFNVVILEKDSKPGGHVYKLSRIYPFGKNGKELIEEKLRLIEKNGIKIINNCQIKWITGSFGNFKCNFLQRSGEEQILDASAVVIATGHKVYEPNNLIQYKYKKSPNIITLFELSQILNNNNQSKIDLLHLNDEKNVKNVLMIQCVGSRDVNNCEYCSRYCCTSAIDHAIELKEKFQNINITINYFDIRTPFEQESIYRKARELGIDFLRGKIGEININDNNQLVAQAIDTVLGKIVELKSDLIVLSTAIMPNFENIELFNLLNLELQYGGFIKEYYEKLKKIETKRKGIYVCGTASGPKTIPECIYEAHAVSLKILQEFGDGEIEKALTVTTVDEDLCNGCELCARICPFNIPIMKEVNAELKAEIDPFSCKGCGICSSICPTGAAQLQTNLRDQLIIQIKGMLRDIQESKEPIILGFVCDECGYATIDAAGILNLPYSEKVRFIRLPCIGRVSLLDIFSAFEEGASGVLLIGCAKDRCHYLKGNSKTEIEVEIAKEVLKEIGWAPERIEFYGMFHAEPQKFIFAVNEMIGRINKLGITNSLKNKGGKL